MLRLTLVALILSASSPASAQLSGAYTVGGASPDFSTPGTAAAALNAQGVNGPVKLVIRPGTYEGTVSLGVIAGASGSNDVLFQASNPANPPVLRNSAATSVTNYVVRLDGAANVIFENLRFEATAPGSNGRLIEIRGGSSSNISITDCTFLGLPGTTGVAASIVTVATPEMPGLTVRNNTFTQGYAGLDLSEDVYGLTMEDNVFDGQDAFGARLRGHGILARNQVNDGPTSQFAYVGLSVSSALTGYRVLANTVVVKRGTTGISTPSAAAVYNNSVAMSSPSGLRGIEAGGTLVAHNTVRTTLNAHALEVSSIFPTTLSGNLLLSIGNGAALRLTSSLAASDNNNLYSAGASVVSQGATGYATLAAWQAASGEDAASVSKTVSFVSTGTSPDLHLAGASLTDPYLTGSTIPEVPRDADNDIRDTYNAKMGADEGTPLPPLAGTYLVAGSLPAFTTPQLFFDNLAGRGMTGAVTARIRGGTFPLQASLPSDLRVGAAAASPSSARLVVEAFSTLTPVTLTATGVTETTNWVIRLDGTDYVTLRNLKMEALPGDYGTLLQLDAGTDNLGTDDLTVFGVAFEGETSGPLGSERTLVSASAGSHDRNQYTGSTFAGGTEGLTYSSASADAVVAFCTFTDQTTIGMSGRLTRLVAVDNVFTGSNLGTRAINLTYQIGYTVLRNRIAYTSASSIGIYVVGADAAPGSPGLIANNFVRAGAPVLVDAFSDGARIVHNTLYTNNGAGIPLRVTVASNNVAQIAGNLLISASGGRALSIESGSTVSASNGNVFWSTGSTLVHYAGTSYATLDAYQGASGLDGDSRVFLPSFVNTSSDLHLAPSMDGDARFASIPVADVTTDIDNQLRSASLPYAGADELSALVPLVGTYAVGLTSGQPPPDFATLPDALFAVETLGVSGPVTLQLASGPLTGPYTIRAFPGASATNRLTVRGTFGSPNTPTIHNPGTSDADNAALRIDGASHVSLSYLTLEGTMGTSSYGRGLVLEGNVEDIVVNNVTFFGRTDSFSFSDVVALVYASEGTTTDLVIQNSLFENGTIGISLTASSGTRSTGTVLNNLTLTGASQIGVRLQRHDAPQLTDVVITGGAITSQGIYLSSGTGGIISRAQVNLPWNSSLASAVYLSAQSGTSGAPFVVENSLLTAAGNALFVSSTNFLRVVHTSLLATGSFSTTSVLNMASGTDLVLRNNLLVHSAGQRAVNLGPFPVSVAESDHNVLRTTGPILATIGSTDYATLAAYQSATGLDAASVNVPVTFADAATGDLHLAGASIGDAALAAPPLPDVPRDFDNVLRSTTAVYKGADENSAPLAFQVLFGMQAWLQGAGEFGGEMRTDLAAAGAIPLTQPYSDSAYDGTPLDYDGSESVPAGFFAANPDFVDWVIIGLRSTPAGPDVARRAFLINKFGSVREGATGTILSFPVQPGSYHVVVYHRNHVAMMSIALSLSASAAFAQLDTPSGTYGAAAAGVVLPSGRLALAAGDGDGDGSVLAGDRQAVWLPTVGQTGYLGGDFNLDGNVLADDRQSFWAPNVGRQSNVPGASLRGPDRQATADR